MILKHTTNRNMNNVFDEIFNTFPASWGTDSRNETSLPPVNIFESTDAYHLELNVPGRSKDDFKINLEKSILTVSYDQKNQEENIEIKILKREFTPNSFKRSFSVDEKINTEAIQAQYENGILKLQLPKKEEVKNSPKQIHIQ